MRKLFSDIQDETKTLINTLAYGCIIILIFNFLVGAIGYYFPWPVSISSVDHNQALPKILQALTRTWQIWIIWIISAGILSHIRFMLAKFPFEHTKKSICIITDTLISTLIAVVLVNVLSTAAVMIFLKRFPVASWTPGDWQSPVWIFYIGAKIFLAPLIEIAAFAGRSTRRHGLKRGLTLGLAPYAGIALIAGTIISAIGFYNFFISHL